MSPVSVPKFLNLALAIFYQSLTKGEIPTVRRGNVMRNMLSNEANWSDFLAYVKGKDVDKFSLFESDSDPEVDGGVRSGRFDSVWFKTMDKNYFSITFLKIDGEWAFDYIDWSKDRKDSMTSMMTRTFCY